MFIFSYAIVFVLTSSEEKQSCILSHEFIKMNHLRAEGDLSLTLFFSLKGEKRERNNVIHRLLELVIKYMFNQFPISPE